MSAQWELGHGMVVTREANRLCITNLVNDVDTTACVFQPEATTGTDFLVALGMQLCEALAKLELIAIDHDGTIGALLPFHGIRR